MNPRTAYLLGILSGLLAIAGAVGWAVAKAAE